MNNMEQMLLLKEGQVNFQIPLKIQKAFSGMQMENLPSVFKDVELEQGRYFWGYASVDAVDVEGDRIDLGALAKAAPQLTVPPYNKIFLGHEYKDIAAGLIKATAIDEYGLLILAKLNDSHVRAEEVWKSINDGFLDGFSIGGSFLQVEPVYDQSLKQTINVVRELVIREVTLTSIPANPFSQVLGAFQKSRKMFADDKKQENSDDMIRAGSDNNSEKFKYKGDFCKVMVKKEEVMKKLSAGEALTADELKFVSENLVQKDANDTENAGDAGEDKTGSEESQDASESDEKTEESASTDEKTDEAATEEPASESDTTSSDESSETQKSLNTSLISKVQDLETKVKSLEKELGDRKSVKVEKTKYSKVENEEPAGIVDWLKGN